MVVTHSLDEALLRRYDGILVLPHGRVVETGQFQELMDRKGLFLLPVHRGTVDRRGELRPASSM